MESSTLASQVLFRMPDRIGQPFVPAGERDVMEPVTEVRPVVVHDVRPGEFLARLTGEIVELPVVELLERGADDLVVGEQPGSGESQQTGEELAPGQVAGGAEEHDDVGLEGVGRLGHRIEDRWIVGGEEIGFCHGAHGDTSVVPRRLPAPREATHGMFRLRVGRERAV